MWFFTKFMLFFAKQTPQTWQIHIKNGCTAIEVIAKPQIYRKNTGSCHSEPSEESVQPRFDVVRRFIIKHNTMKPLAKENVTLAVTRENIKYLLTSNVLQYLYQSYRSFDFRTHYTKGILAFFRSG